MVVHRAGHLVHGRLVLVRRGHRHRERRHRQRVPGVARLRVVLAALVPCLAHRRCHRRPVRSTTVAAHRLAAAGRRRTRPADLLGQHGVAVVRVPRRDQRIRRIRQACHRCRRPQPGPRLHRTTNGERTVRQHVGCDAGGRGGRRWRVQRGLRATNGVRRQRRFVRDRDVADRPRSAADARSSPRRPAGNAPHRRHG